MNAGTTCRVLHCIQSLEVGGAERQLSYLAPQLVALGWPNCVASLRGGVHESNLAAEGVVLARIEARSNYDPKILIGMRRVIRRFRPDVLIAWLPQMHIAAGITARCMGVPWILCERTSARAYRRGWRESIRRLVARSAAGVVANSESGATYWRESVVGRCEVTVVPNAVPLEAIDAVTRVHNAAVEGHDRGPRILVVGRLIRTRRIDVLIEALRSEGLEDATLTICGDGPTRGDLEAHVARASLSERIRFEGTVGNPWSFMATADVMVSLSEHEGEPNACLEAAAAGCPMVLSDIPEHRAIFNADDVVFTDAARPDMVGRAVMSVLVQADSTRSRVRSARERVGGRGATVVARRFADAVGRAIARAGR